MKRQLIAEAWNEYVQMVLPKDASREQKVETRRAFYAGASTLFYGLLAGLDEDKKPTAEDMKKMSDVSEEITKFYDDVKAGRA